MKKKEIIDAAYRVCLNKPITAVEMKDDMLSCLADSMVLMMGGQ